MWETFRRRTRPSPKDPMVTLGKGGMLGLNSAVTRNLLGDNKFAHLLFDKEKHLIGIKLLKHNDVDAYPIKCSKSMSHGSIAGVSFLKTYEIFPSETRAYPATFDEANRIIVVDVSGKESRTIEAGKRGRR